jgi:hypothetical protein
MFNVSRAAPAGELVVRSVGRSASGAGERTMDDLVALLFLLAPAVPYLLIYAVGGILCVARWRHHPRRSRLALWAFGLFFGRLLVGGVVRNWLLLRRSDFGWDDATLAIYLAIVNGCDLLTGIVGWVFLLVALFRRDEYFLPMTVQDGEERFREIPGTGIQEGRRPLNAGPNKTA